VLPHTPPAPVATPVLASPESPFENIIIDESSPDAAKYRRLRKGPRPRSTMLTIHEDTTASVVQNLQTALEVIGTEATNTEASADAEANLNAEVIVQPQANAAAATDVIPPASTEVIQHASTEANDDGTVLAYNGGEPVRVLWPRLQTPEPISPHSDHGEYTRPLNLKPVPRHPHIRGAASIDRLRLNVRAFKADNTFFDSGKNPYTKPRIPSDRFWSIHM
jgi:hypothetical protein